VPHDHNVIMTSSTARFSRSHSKILHQYGSVAKCVKHIQSWSSHWYK